MTDARRSTILHRRFTIDPFPVPVRDDPTDPFDGGIGTKRIDDWMGAESAAQAVNRTDSGA